MLISWNTTGKCNLYCRHCYRRSGPEVSAADELDTAEGERLLEQIREAGFRLIIFSGGEPLLRPDIFRLIRFAAGLGLRPVLGTNGTLIDGCTAGLLAESGAAGVGISIDSPEPQYHDEFRGCPGAHSRAIEGIVNTLEAGLKVQINMTLTGKNFDHFDRMADLAEELGVTALHPFFMLPAGRGHDIGEDIMTEERYFWMLRAVLERQKTTSLELKPTCAPQFLPMASEMGLKLRFGRGCLAGVSYCCILPGAEVHICPYLPVSAGNVRETSFAGIWNNSEVFRNLRNYGEYGGRCGECEDVAVCGGCRARAFFSSGGDYMSQDPWCYKKC